MAQAVGVKEAATEAGAGGDGPTADRRGAGADRAEGAGVIDELEGDRGGAGVAADTGVVVVRKIASEGGADRGVEAKVVGAVDAVDAHLALREGMSASPRIGTA